MVDVVTNLIAERKIPALNDIQFEGLLHHLFTGTSNVIRVQVAEVACCYDRKHPRSFDVFLASTFPLAEGTAYRKAQRIFVRPSDWQVELMYDGAVQAAIRVFEMQSPLKAENHAFRRYLLRALALGAVRSYFQRGEYDGIRSVGNLAALPIPKGPFRNEVEGDLMTWELLEQVTQFPHLRPELLATLQCIRTLGPDHVIRERHWICSGDPDKWKCERGRRPILDPNVIAQAMGITKARVHQYLREARIILRQAFNQDGKLFLIH